ncbi:MAG TPA: ROK family protein [Bacillota bacterium]
MGIDLGGSHAAAGLVDGDGRVLARARIPLQATADPLAVADVLAGLVAGICRDGDRPLEAVTGIGVGVPGGVDPAGTHILHAPNLGWRQVPFAELLATRLGVPPGGPAAITLDNDANCAAVGEHWAGAGRGSAHMVCVTLGTGVGAGLILNGRLYRGGFGLAGELGHVPLARGGGSAAEGPACGCGLRGCFETAASARALAEAAGTLGRGDARAALAAADAGDERARAAEQRFLDALADGLATVIDLLDPERIVIAGGLAGRGRALLDPLRRRLAERTFLSGLRLPELVTGRLGDAAGIAGAAALVLEPAYGR